MAISEIKSAVAAYHQVTLADLTVNGQDLFLLAANQAIKTAEQLHDFNFNRKLLTLSVSTTTGGSLVNAVLQGTSTTVKIKTILDIGTFDTNGEFIPQEWTSYEESLERHRLDNSSEWLRRPSDPEDTRSEPYGQTRFTIINDTLAYWPKAATAETISAGILADVYTTPWTGNTTIAITGVTGVTFFNATYYLVGTYLDRGLWLNINPLDGTLPADNIARFLFWDGTMWFMSTGNDLGSVASGNYASTAASVAQTPAGLSFTGAGTVGGTIVAGAITPAVTASNDVWVEHGSSYIQWSCINQLNRRFKTFIPRQEGNIPSPSDLEQQALQAFVDWDVFRVEGHRRHNR